MTKNLQKTPGRLYMIDSLRGLAIVLMVVYHAFYNVRYIFGNPFGWTLRLYPLQQAACWLFILVSGFSFALSRNNLRRGLLVSACGIGLTVFTTLFMPSERIVWGVLSFLGAAMLLTHAARPMLARIPAGAGLAAAAALFVLTRDIPYGWLGFEGHWIAPLPAAFYETAWLFPLGFPGPDFWSADYFPLLPWGFLYACGWFLYRLLPGNRPSERAEGSSPPTEAAFPERLLKRRIPVLAELGRHSLLIYLLHQPVIFGTMWIVFR